MLRAIAGNAGLQFHRGGYSPDTEDVEDEPKISSHVCDPKAELSQCMIDFSA